MLLGAGIVGASACLGGLPAMGQGSTNPTDYLTTILVDDGNPATSELGIGHKINSTTFKAEAMLTRGDYQYFGYYHESGDLYVARRTLSTDTFDFARTQFTSNNLSDAHNVITMGIDGDGFMHLSWGMHAHDLLYTRSTTPITAGQTMNFVGGSTGNSAAINTMTGNNETRVTYPMFFSIPDSDDLLYTYRTGGSGNGVYRLSRYNDANNTWGWADQTWINNTDSTGNTYNAYPHNLSYDPDGNLHATWTFRGSASSSQTNRNLLYAVSPDDGVTWFKDRAMTQQYPSTINELNAQVIVPIPEGSSLINAGTQAVDPTTGDPALATFWAPLAQSGDNTRQYMFVWNDGTDWRTSQITDRANDSGMARPQVMFDDDGRALVLYVDNDGGRGLSVAYSESDDRDDWVHIDLTTTHLGGNYEPTFDRTRWERDGILSVYVERANVGAGEPVNIVEWDADAYFEAISPTAFDLVYRPGSGKLMLDTKDKTLYSYTLQGTGFLEQHHLSVLNGTLTSTDTLLTEANFFSPETGVFLLGQVLPTGMDQAELEALLSQAQFTDALGGTPRDFNLVIEERHTLVYDAATGELTLDTVGGTLKNYVIQSNGGFIEENHTAIMNELVTSLDFNLSETGIGFSGSGQFSLGMVMPTNLSPEQFEAFFTTLTYVADFGAPILNFDLAYTSVPGDTDLDGDIDDTDLGFAISNFTGPAGAGKTVAQGDTDGDGDVDDTDIGVMISGFTGPLSPASVPEPTSLALVTLGGLLLARRRRDAA